MTNKKSGSAVYDEGRAVYDEVCRVTAKKLRWQRIRALLPGLLLLASVAAVVVFDIVLLVGWFIAASVWQRVAFAAMIAMVVVFGTVMVTFGDDALNRYDQKFDGLMLENLLHKAIRSTTPQVPVDEMEFRLFRNAVLLDMDGEKTVHVQYGVYCDDDAVDLVRENAQAWAEWMCEITLPSEREHAIQYDIHSECTVPVAKWVRSEDPTMYIDYQIHSVLSEDEADSTLPEDDFVKGEDPFLPVDDVWDEVVDKLSDEAYGGLFGDEATHPRRENPQKNTENPENGNATGKVMARPSTARRTYQRK